jgi:hypothetical protein
MLDKIMERVTRSHQPTTRLLNEITTVTNLIGKILKCESSEESKHVKILKSLTTSSLGPEDDIQALLTEQHQ